MRSDPGGPPWGQIGLSLEGGKKRDSQQPTVAEAESSAQEEGEAKYPQQISNIKRYMYPNAHCSIFYNSQDMEATQVSSTSKWIKKMWYTHTT